jgi:putative IMPACT (imprinted ancient) family translation regulator
MPILQVMRGNGLIDSAILVVRYFGGIKLGTGGMARAYGEAAKKVLAKATPIPYEKTRTLRFFTPYDQARRWEYETAKADSLEVERAYDEKGVAWRLEGGERAIGELAKKLERARIPFLLE